MTRFFPAFAALLWILGAAAAQAQDLTLRQALDLALRSHPILLAGQEKIQVAAGLKLQSGLRPNPRFIFQQENWRVDRATPLFRPGRDLDTFLYLQQVFETGGKRARRVDLSAAEQRRAELSRELLEREIAGRVKEAYWIAVGAQRVHELLLESVRNFDQIVEYHAIRVREGVMAEADLLKVQLERDRVVASANAAALEAERGRIALFREMGLGDYPAGGLADKLEVPPATLAPDVAQAIANRAEVKLAQQIVESAKTNVRLQQANATPDVEALFGYKRTSGFDTLMGGLQINLPVLNRNQGNIAAADSGTRAAEAELAAAKALVAAEVRAAAADVNLKQKQIMELFPGILKKAEESARIAEAAYKEGGTDLLRLLDAVRVRIDASLQYAQTLAEYRRSIAALETAMGVVNP
jgi:cobalt-zinc-cadmium efflux system outer membrane protein